MLRSLLSAAVLACVLILAPTGESQKEISTAHATEPVVNVLSDLLIATAHAHPCAIVVTATQESSEYLSQRRLRPSAVPLPKPKPHFAPTKQKKKSASVPTKEKKKNHHRHHHSHHHHSNHAPQKIFGAHGPSHLTQPPGCG